MENKLNKYLIKNFETEQKNWGTKVALSNFTINIISNILRSINIKGIKFIYGK